MAQFKKKEDIDLVKYYDHLLRNLPYGLNILLIHPSKKCDEIKGITRNTNSFGFEWREMDYTYFNSEHCRQLIQKNNIKLVTWKDLID